MSTSESTRPVLQLRLVIEVDDYDEAVAFYRDALGLTEQASYEGDGDARVAILEAGRATLEIANRAQRQMIDDVEVGHQTGASVRVAFEVPDAEARTGVLVDAGARLVAAPVETPWRSLNARLEGPGPIPMTLFQELEPLEERQAKDGFGTDADRHA